MIGSQILSLGLLVAGVVASSPAVREVKLQARQFPNTTTPVKPPAKVGNSVYIGCFEPASDTPAPALVDGSLTIEKCTAACPSTKYAGVYTNQCYCLDTLPDHKEPDASCSLPCPGNPRESCGGPPPLNKMLKRQSGALGLLTIYEVNGVSPAPATPSTPAKTPSITVNVNLYFIFEVCTSKPAVTDVVYILEECSCEGGHAYVVCTDIEAAWSAGVKLYKAIECSSKNATIATTTEVVYKAHHCDTCEGGYVFVECPSGTTTTLAPAKTTEAVTYIKTGSSISAVTTEVPSIPTPPPAVATGGVHPEPSHVVTAGAGSLAAKTGLLLLSAAALVFMM